MRFVSVAAAFWLLCSCSRAHEGAKTSPSSPESPPLAVHTARLEPSLPPLAELGNQSPFGIATSHRSAKNLLSWLPAVREAGVSWLRGFDVSAAEDRLSDAERAQVDVAGFLAWSPAGKRLTFPVDNLAEWSQYVEKLVTRCKGRVKYWEVWNEPPNFTEDKSPESYAKVVVAAYRAAKKVDPDVQIGLATRSNYVQWLDAAIQAGAKDHFDYLTVHPYELLGGVARGGEPLFLSIVPTLRKMLQARNPERKDAPVWFTELGQPVDQHFDAEQQAITVLKAYTLSIAQGAARVHWFEGRDGDSGPFGLLDGNGNKRPSYHALAALIRALGPVPKYVGWLVLEQGSYGFVFAAEGRHVMLAWAPPGQTEQVHFEGEVTALDPIRASQSRAQSVSLTEAPLILAGLPQSLVARAAANARQPFYWDGDYSGMKSISLEAPDVQSGLHQLSAPNIRWFGNQPARDASHSPKQVFVVDPNFLSYTTVPLRITIVAKRNGAAKAGFNLKYESTSGLKTVQGGWYTIPESPDFTSKDFVIDDSQFVGNWAYHFMLDSDSPAFSQYSIQSVTVAKL